MKTNFFCPLVLIGKLEARAENILNQYSNAGADHVDQVAEEWPEILPEYMAITDLFSDCVTYMTKHAPIPTDYTGAL